MKRAEKEYEINLVIDEVNDIKDHLMHCVDRLEDICAIREANSLDTLIGKLEAWQNKNYK